MYERLWHIFAADMTVIVPQSRMARGSRCMI
jgi:hypothetical protein